MPNYIDLGEQINNYKMYFNLVPKLWDDFRCDCIDLNAVTWHKCKFLNSDGSELSNEMKNLPNNKGGIYLFFVKPPVIPGLSKYLMYIGRAKLTDKHNLRVRCTKYFTEYHSEKSRPKIARLLSYWGKYLYVYYIELEDNALIDELEAILINSLLPPCNDYIPAKTIRAAVKAFD